MCSPLAVIRGNHLTAGPASEEAAKGGVDRADVAAAEQVDVGQEGVELIERHAVGVAGGAGVRLVVGGEAARAGAAEEREHGEVDLAVAAVDGRVDEDRGAALIAVQVA